MNVGDNLRLAPSPLTHIGWGDCGLALLTQLMGSKLLFIQRLMILFQCFASLYRPQILEENEVTNKEKNKDHIKMIQYIVFGHVLRR